MTPSSSFWSLALFYFVKEEIEVCLGEVEGMDLKPQPDGFLNESDHFQQLHPVESFYAHSHTGQENY